MGHNKAGDNKRKKARRRKKDENLATKKAVYELYEQISKVYVRNETGTVTFLKDAEPGTICYELPESMSFVQAVRFIDNLGKNNESNVGEPAFEPWSFK